MTLSEPTRPDRCLSDLGFDSSFAGDPRARIAVEAHLRHCARCRARHAELSAEREAFLLARPSLELPPRPEGRARPGVEAPRRSAVEQAGTIEGMPAPASARAPASRSWFAGLRKVPGVSSPRRATAAWSASAFGVCFAAAAAALLWLRPEPAPVEPGVRRKGGPRFEFFVEASAVAASRSRASAAPARPRVAPGDRVRFAYTSERPAYLAVLALDGRGTASVYFPGGARAAPVGSGAGRVLDSAVELDESLGPEQVFAVFCDAPFTLEPLRQELAARGALAAASGCWIERLAWVKEQQR